MARTGGPGDTGPDPGTGRPSSRATACHPSRCHPVQPGPATPDLPAARRHLHRDTGLFSGIIYTIAERGAPPALRPAPAPGQYPVAPGGADLRRRAPPGAHHAQTGSPAAMPGERLFTSCSGNWPPGTRTSRRPSPAPVTSSEIIPTPTPGLPAWLCPASGPSSPGPGPPSGLTLTSGRPTGPSTGGCRKPASTLGYPYLVLWNVDPQDWSGIRPSPIVSNVLAGMAPGAVVVLHDLTRPTVDALPGILDGLRARHLSAVTLTQLLAAGKALLS